MTNKPLGRPCCIDDCSKPVKSDGGYDMCGMHYQRWRKHGSPHIVRKGGASLPLARNPNWTGDQASYAAVHLRLRYNRGRASKFPCIDCGAQAAHWSYNNSDPNQRVDVAGWPYSTDLTNYDPRCVPCHSAHDRGFALLTGERP